MLRTAKFFAPSWAEDRPEPRARVRAEFDWVGSIPLSCPGGIGQVSLLAEWPLVKVDGGNMRADYPEMPNR